LECITNNIAFQRYVAMAGLLHSNYTGHSSLSDISLTCRTSGFWLDFHLQLSLHWPITSYI